jgi:hypothetical protein
MDNVQKHNICNKSRRVGKPCSKKFECVCIRFKGISEGNKSFLEIQAKKNMNADVEKSGVIV